MSMASNEVYNSVQEPTKGEIRRAILNLAWPATVESLLQMGVGLVNTGMVGHLSAVAIGAVGLTNRATMFAWALFQTVSTGATVLVAQAIGAGDRDEARTAAVQGLLFGFTSVACLAVIFGLIPGPLLSLFRPDPELLEAARQYMRIYIIGMPAVGIMTAAGAAMRGAGDTRSPMVIAVMVNIINLAGNWLLIYGNMGFPALGINGSGIATVVAQWIGASVAMWTITSRNSRLGLSIRGPWRFDRPVLSRMLNMGLPAAGESFAWQTAAAILTIYITSFGINAYAAHQLGTNAESLSYMPTAGFEIATITLVGQAIGARNYRLARTYARELTIVITVVTTFTAGLLFFLPHAILGLLTKEVEVIALGAIYLKLMATAQIPQQVAGVMKGALRGSGDTRTPLYIAAIGLWGVRLPAAYLLGFTFELGVAGVWAGMTLDLWARFILMAWRYRRVPWLRDDTRTVTEQVAVTPD